MPSLAMESRQANVRPTRSVQKPYQFDVDTAQPSIKEEDVGDDGDALTYRSRPQLPEAYKCMRNLAHLMKHMEDGTIDVDPEYQREVVWTAERMTSLVNSLMENFYIPPIILNKKPRPSEDSSASQETLVCVDGKQRLSSVLAFVKGMIPCHDHRGEKWWFIEPAGNKKKRVLPEQVRNQFLRKEFISFEYTNLSPEQEEDLFARVQMGMQLNLAEKMRASTGPWQELARLFVEDFPAIYSLMKDRARSKDFQITLSCFSQIVECMHPTNPNGLPVLKTNHTHLPKLLSNKGAVDDNLKSHLASVWNTFKTMIEIDPSVFTNANKYLRGVQTFAPVEMVAVAVLISTHSETRNNSLLLGDIKAMRAAVREDFVDLRLNATVWKWFWDYIDNLESIRGAIDGSTVDRQFNRRTKRPAVGATAGSTASSIVSAAAAPRRGRATARTKRPAIIIPEGTLTVTKQEDVVSTSSETHVPKRRRTGDGTPDIAPIEPIQRITLETGLSLANKTQELGQLPSTRSQQEPPLPSVPVRVSTQKSRIVAHEPRPGNEPSSSVLLRTAASSVNSPRTQTPLSTPLEARLQRISELDSYQSPYPPSAYPIQSEQSSNRGILTVKPQAPTAPMAINSHGHSLANGSSVASSARSNSPGKIVPKSATPSVQSTSRVSPKSETREALQKPQTNLARPSQQQYIGIIDLTDDVEQERQSLLSAFKTDPTRNVSSQSATTPITQTRLSIAGEQEQSSRRRSTKENNPYARFKNK